MSYCLHYIYSTLIDMPPLLCNVFSRNCVLVPELYTSLSRAYLLVHHVTITYRHISVEDRSSIHRCHIDGTKCLHAFCIWNTVNQNDWDGIISCSLCVKMSGLTESRPPVSRIRYTNNDSRGKPQTVWLVFSSKTCSWICQAFVDVRLRLSLSENIYAQRSYNVLLSCRWCRQKKLVMRWWKSKTTVST